MRNADDRKLKRLIYSAVLLLLAVLLAAYSWSALSGADMACGYLSLVTAGAAGAAGAVLLAAGIATDSGYPLRVLFIAEAAACFSWVIGDILWVADLSRGVNPTKSLETSFWYLLPTIVCSIATLVFALRQNSKWLSAKGILESAVASVVGVLFIWAVEFSGAPPTYYAMESATLLTLTWVILDLFVLAQIARLFISADKGSLRVFFVLTGLGFFIYAATDIACFIFGYHSVYGALYTLGGLYILAFVLGAAGGLHYMLFRRGKEHRVIYRNFKNRFVYLLVFPAAATLLKGFSLPSLFTFAIVFGLYIVAFRLIHQAEAGEKLLEKERADNELLESRLEAQYAELTALQDRDTVTQLFNRRYFNTCLERAIRQLRHNEIVAVLQFDVDRFKSINDNYGHAFGDKVIAEIADRLREWNRCGAVLARLGGDEFAVLLQGGYSRYDIGVFSRQIMEVCSAPLYVDTQVLYVTISIGISLCPNDAADGVTLLKNSDISMYKAKSEGYSKYVFYNDAFKENIRQKIELEALLRKADLEKDFELVFQPQFSLPDRRLVGAEALIRWNSAEHGYVPPNVFIPVAEEINYIGRIGTWVLAKAIRQIIQWNDNHELNLKMGVNISPRQLTEKYFFATLKSLINESGVNTAWLDAEITENLMIEEKTKVNPIFNLFRELGISVSIDDFGSGYSSLGYLNKFHFDRIKIDKSLVDNLLIPDGSGREVVKAIINMANAVGKVTLAEGVEKPEQLKILEDLGCQQVQGYLLGRPMSAEEFTERHIRVQVGISQADVPEKRGKMTKKAVKQDGN